MVTKNLSGFSVTIFFVFVLNLEGIDYKNALAAVDWHKAMPFCTSSIGITQHGWRMYLRRRSIMVKLFQRRIKRAKKEKRELVAWILWNALKPAIIKAEILGDWLYYTVHRKAENSCLLALYTFTRCASYDLALKMVKSWQFLSSSAASWDPLETKRVSVKLSFCSSHTGFQVFERQTCANSTFS